MAISLYDLSIPTYLQTLAAASHFVDRGLAHCKEHGIDPQEIVDTRVFPDMLPFRFQIQSIFQHSVRSMDAVMRGTFQPAGDKTSLDYAALQSLLKEAQESLNKLTPDEVNAREGATVTFQLGDRTMPFTAENFVLSFSLPNFHFHAATAYNILRSKGVPLGKRDYMGRVRMNR